MQLTCFFVPLPKKWMYMERKRINRLMTYNFGNENCIKCRVTKIHLMGNYNIDSEQADIMRKNM